MTPTQAKTQLHQDLLDRGIVRTDLAVFDAQYDEYKTATDADIAYTTMLEMIDSMFRILKGYGYS